MGKENEMCDFYEEFMVYPKETFDKILRRLTGSYLINLVNKRVHGKKYHNRFFTVHTTGYGVKIDKEKITIHAQIDIKR